MTDLHDRLSQSVTWQEARTSGSAVDAALPVGREAGRWLASLARDSREIIFSGAGSSYYLAMTVASAHRTVTGLPALAVPPSELLLRPASAIGRDVPTEISRSGSTSEIVDLIERSSQQGRATIGITCRADAPLALRAGRAWVSPGGDEKAVVMTRSFASMLALALRAIAGAAVELAASADVVAAAARIGADLEGLPRAWSSAEPLITQALELAAQPWIRVVVLGGGPALGLAQEACLKLTEMSQVAANAWEPFEFRHGPISVCEPGVLVVGLVGGEGLEEERRVLAEAQSLGATVWTLDPETIGGDIDPIARLPLLLPPLQALAIGHAFTRGLDPDRPRHLSQVVRVGS